MTFRIFIGSLVVFLMSLVSNGAQACTTKLDITGVIGPATVDLMNRLERRVKTDGCTSALLEINTPGGNLESTRRITEKILNFPVPVLCLVAPAGAHAGSAGAIILQACHVNGAIRGTNLGAATPIESSGRNIPSDLRRKILNDTESWLDSMTELRGRNRQFGRDIIAKAKAVTAEEALKLKAIDTVSDTPAEFLKFAQGRTVKMSGGMTAKVQTGELADFPLDTRYHVLSVLTDPEMTYLIFLGSMALLFFEFTHPGMILPGVVGGLGMIVSLVAMHRLDVEWGGLLLIFLGVGLLIAEVFVTSFGALGIGGLVSFILGSVFLFDPVKTGYRLPLSLIVPATLILAAIFFGLGILVLRTFRVKKRGSFDEMIGAGARVTMVESGGRKGKVEIMGETWNFESIAPVKKGETVTVVAYQDLTLKVQSVPEET